MEENRSSATSWGVAGLRAAHQLIDGEPKLLRDEVILQLMGPGFTDHIKDHPDAYRDPGSIGLRSHVLLRSRYAEDCLAEAYDRGVRQYVLMGAGLDTYAWRQDPARPALRIFEVDYPGTQQHKQELLSRAGLATPGNVRFVPLDLESSTPAEALALDGYFDPSQPAFVSWLGVMVYLSRPAIDRVFDWLFSLPAGSEMVLTFTQKRPFDRLGARAAALGEPWQTFFTPRELEDTLRQRGFTFIHFLQPWEAWQRYYSGWQRFFSGRTNGLPAPAHSSIARIGRVPPAR